MIDQKAREALLELVEPGDYKVAARIYEDRHQRSIYPRYLQKMLNGERKVKGRHKSHHQPLYMYEAIVEAIKERKNNDAISSEKALELTKQLQPC